jgi:hypothetical protein
MADDEGKGTGENDEGKTKSGGNQGGARTYTEDDLKREVDRRVQVASKGWHDDLKTQLDKAGADSNEKIKNLEAMHKEQASKADFLEAVSDLRLGVRDAKAAYAVFKQYQYTDKDGKPDIEAMRKAHPALFGDVSRVKTNGGAHTEAHGAEGGGVDNFIRKAAGRGGRG